jgi:hypothetical protein
MTVQLGQSSGAFIEARVSGTFTQADQNVLQDRTAALVAAGQKPRVLIVLGQFTGWEKGARWGDVTFMMGPGEHIVRMAIVGEERWRDDVLLFVAKGLRPTAIEFFPPSQIAAARAWATG